MILSHPLRALMARRFRRPAGEDGSDDGAGTGGDRGDDFVPTEDDVTDVTAKVKTGDEGTDTAAEEAAAAAKVAADAKAADEAKEKDEKDEKADGKDKKKDSRIPLGRHQEILAKEREAREAVERQLAAYQKGAAVANVNETITKLEDQVVKLDEEYAKLITDGKQAEALVKMREIRKLEREIGDKKTDMAAAAASARAVEKARYDIVVERLEAAYPQLNPDGEGFDEEASQDVLDLATTYRAKGMTPGEAIQKAARKLLKTETTQQEKATTVAPRVDADAAAKAAAEAEERKKAQVKKNVDVSGKQPPSTTKVGADHDKSGGSLDAKQVMRMSQDQFAKLSEDDLARLRGDVIA